MKLGEWLKTKQMTQAEFAKLINTNQGHVSELCSGSHRPRVATMDLVYTATKGEVAHADWSEMVIKPKAVAKPRPVRIKKVLQAAARKATR